MPRKYTRRLRERRHIDASLFAPIHIRSSGDYSRAMATWRCWAARRRRLLVSSASRRRMAFVATTFALVGCGGSQITVQHAPSTSSSRPGTTFSTAQTTSKDATKDNGQDAAILAAYAGSVEDFDAVATRAPVQGNSPILAAHMSGRELEGVVSQLLKLAEQNQVNTGMLSTIDSNVKEFRGSEAVVAACNRDTVGTANASTGQVVNQPASSTEFVNAIVQRVGDVWKVEYVSNVSAGCA